VLIIAKCLAVYVVLAAGYHFLLEPVAKSSPAANKAVVERVPQPLAAPMAVAHPTDVLSPAPVKHVRPGVAVPPPDAARAFAAVPPKKRDSTATEAKSNEGKSEGRPVTRQVVRTTERRERRSREAAFNPFNIFRPWF
jgi:hypothetical protein